MTALAILVVLALPAALLIGFMQLANVLERRRAEVIARQIQLTDAIHAELGPVVAPLVRRGRGGRFIGMLPVPPAYPEIGRMIQLTHAVLGAAAEIVVVAPEPVPARRYRTAAARTPALSGARVTR
jgi:hypothetical protein